MDSVFGRGAQHLDGHYWGLSHSKDKAERAAYRQAKLFGFVLAPAYQKTPIHQIASLLLWRWPAMEELFELVGGAALHELPIGRSGKIKPLPL